MISVEPLKTLRFAQRLVEGRISVVHASKLNRRGVACVCSVVQFAVGNVA